MRLVAFGALAFSLLFAQPSLAGDAAAEALFRAGREAADQGDYATACARFEESQRLEPAAGTVFNLALCYEKRGQIALAWQRFREARERLSGSDERLHISEERIATLEPRLPRLTLQLGSPAPGTVVTRDGVELGAASLGVAVPVDPGTHEIVVRAPGHAPRTVTVQIAEAQHKEVILELGPPDTTKPSASTLPPARTEVTTSSRGATRSAGYVVTGLGVAGIATSLVTGAMVLNRKHTVEDECNGSLCSRKGVDAADSGRTLSTVSTIAFAAGAVGVGVGLYLVLSSKDEPEVARVELVTLPGLTTLGVGGRF